MGGPRYRRLLTLALALSLTAFLFVQPGLLGAGINDEAEHLHAAWLMAVRGLSPLHGFFEHHLPLLWYVLGLGFRAGMKGPESLYWARLLVLACAALWCGALLSLVRVWSREAARGDMALASFAAVAVFAQDLVVVRPETLAFGLLAGSLLIWSRRNGRLAAAFAGGVLFGGTIFASPRFVLLAPVFLLVEMDEGAPLQTILTRACALIAGTAVAGGAIIFWLVPLQDLIFDLRFSAFLQGIGLPAQIDMRYLGACILIPVLFGAIGLGNAAIPRRQLLAWGLNGALAWGVCLLSSGAHAYSQAFAPALLWTTLFVAWLESRPRPAHDPSRRLEAIAISGMLATTATLVGFGSGSMFSAAALTTSRRILLDTLPPGATVLLPYPYHPITADDASYWGASLMVDSPGRLCAAVDAYRQRYPRSPVPLPPCSLLTDLRTRRPSAVYRDLAVIGAPEEYFQIDSAIQTEYESTDSLAGAPTPTFGSYVVFRK